MSIATSYTDIRKYFNGVIGDHDSDLKEWRGALVFEDAENIPSTLIDTSYHIEIGPWSSTPSQDLSVQDSFSITLTIFKKGFNDPTGALDSLLGKALCIKHDLINPVTTDAFKESNDSAIYLVENVSGTPQEINSSNDNIVKIALEFNVRLYFGVIQ